jgi:predicted DNA-binding protein (UPF0278 family)
MTLQEILNTDCYVQFDTNEELREFIERNGLEVDEIYNHETYIAFHAFGAILTVPSGINDGDPIYHHTTITT